MILMAVVCRMSCDCDCDCYRWCYVLCLQAAHTTDKEGLLPMHYASQRDDKNLNLDVVQYILQTNPKGRVGPLVEAPVIDSGANAGSATAASKSGKSGGGFFSKAVSLFGAGGGSSSAGPVRRKSVVQK